MKSFRVVTVCIPIRKSLLGSISWNVFPMISSIGFNILPFMLGWNKEKKQTLRMKWGTIDDVGSAGVHWNCPGETATMPSGTSKAHWWHAFLAGHLPASVPTGLPITLMSLLFLKPVEHPRIFDVCCRLHLNSALPNICGFRRLSIVASAQSHLLRNPIQKRSGYSHPLNLHPFLCGL